MVMPLPLNALEIFVEWRLDNHGLGVTAFTDEAGLPYIGLYPLDWSGIPTGLPTYFQRRRLMADVVVGFVWGQPIVVFIDAEVTVRGLDLRLCLPVLLTPQGGYPRHLSARWGDPAPKFHGFPANNNWLVQPKLRDI
jgi:hypothetical protein